MDIEIDCEVHIMYEYLKEKNPNYIKDYLIDLENQSKDSYFLEQIYSKLKTSLLKRKNNAASESLRGREHSSIND